MSPVGKKTTGILAFLALAAAVLAVLFSGRYKVTATKSPLKTTVLKIGKADAIVVNAGAETLVIDCGEEEDGIELLEYLAAENINKIDTLIITHYDKDHVGGADTVVETIPVGRVIMPDYDNTSSEYHDFLVALKEQGITPERISENTAFTLGDADVIVEPPLNYNIPESADGIKIEYDNNFSLVTTVVHGNNRLFFAGDIEKQRIRSYGVPEENGKVFLEIKKKYMRVVNKRRIALPLRDAMLFVEKNALPARIFFDKTALKEDPDRVRFETTQILKELIRFRNT